MKKYLIFLLLSLVAVSCYEDYIFDYEYTGIYFPYQYDVRTFVVGEGMKIEVGAALGGVRENTMDRTVDFSFDGSLVSAASLYQMQNLSSEYIRTATASVAALELLPATHYTISNASQMVIKEGKHVGTVVVRADSLAFVTDPKSMVATYVLPFRIDEAEADSVVKAKNFNVVAFKYENMLFGKYWHGGATVRLDSVGTIIDTIRYDTQIPTPESKIWVLTTTSPNTVVTNAFSNQASMPNSQLALTLNGGTITLASAPGSTYTFTPDGASTYNQAKLLQERKLYLKYQYTMMVGLKTRYCHATDTLTFRNRIRDGINEWQDENPSNYLK